MADISAIKLPNGSTYDLVDKKSGYIKDVEVNGVSVVDDAVGVISVPTKTSDLTNDSNFMSGMTILRYGSSTWNDFLTAYQSNHIVYCRASSNANPASGAQLRLAFMAYVAGSDVTPTEVEFQYYRSVSSHTAAQQGDQVYVYKLTNKGVWSVTVREASVKVVAGTGLGGTYSNGTMTLTGPTKVSDLTNDAGFITNYTETDPTVPSWAKASTKPSYSLSEISGTTDLQVIENLSGFGLLKKEDAGVWSFDKSTYLTSSSTLDAANLNGVISSAVTATTQASTDNSTKIATTAYVTTAIAALPEPMLFKGSVGTGGTITALPAAASSNEGFTYKVITDLSTPVIAKVGDTVISNGSSWIVIPSGDEPSGTVTSVGLSNATNGGLFISSSPITSSGTITVGHSNVLTSAQTTQAVYPIAIDKNGHISSYGSAVTIPTVNDATLTIQKNGVNIETFSANASSNKIANIVVNEVPSGGTSGQVLTKHSATNYDVEWADASGGGAYIVTFTYDDVEDEYSCDKTAQEIYEANESGMVIIGVTSYDENDFNFFHLERVEKQYIGGVYKYVADFYLFEIPPSNTPRISSSRFLVTDNNSSYEQSGSSLVPSYRTINNKSLLTDITLTASDVGAQESLVSGTNIKTINNVSLLGSGNITIGDGAEPIALTQAEYNALPSADKSNPDKIYFITDGSSSGGSGTNQNIFYGTCTTTGSTQIKEATVDNSFTLQENVVVIITFQNRQLYSGTPKLNINNTGAKTIKRTTSANTGYDEWYSGSVLGFIYNGTDWVSIGLTKGAINGFGFISSGDYLGSIDGISFYQGDNLYSGNSNNISTDSRPITSTNWQDGSIAINLDTNYGNWDYNYFDYDILGISFLVIPTEQNAYPNNLIFHPRVVLPPIDNNGLVYMGEGGEPGVICLAPDDYELLRASYLNYYNIINDSPPIDPSDPSDLLLNVEAKIYYQHGYDRLGVT